MNCWMWKKILITGKVRVIKLIIKVFRIMGSKISLNKIVLSRVLSIVCIKIRLVIKILEVHLFLIFQNQ